MSTTPRRLMYFAYYLRQLDWRLLNQFMTHVTHVCGMPATTQWRNIVHDCLTFNISILEYYQFRFFELDDQAKWDWAGTGTMYEFQRVANPPESRTLLLDKRKFYAAYRGFFRHEVYAYEDLLEHPETLERLLETNDKLVFKDATGNCGKGVLIRSVTTWKASALLEFMREGAFDIAETLIHQHEALQTMSPSAVNTVRVFTQINHDGEYEILGCRLRISVNSPVDNLAAGNLAAPIDEETGVICGPGVYSDITKAPEIAHPITGCPIVGFEIPYWKEVLALVRDASLAHSENRSIGWDVAITNEGPGLIEGNHDWCKLVWQLPVGRGLKHRLDLAQ
jgi:hypothetical protein